MAEVTFHHRTPRLTPQQLNAVMRMSQSWTVKVFPRSFDLPEGYVCIVLDPDRNPVYGGISASGEVST